MRKKNTIAFCYCKKQHLYKDILLYTYKLNNRLFFKTLLNLNRSTIKL